MNTETAIVSEKLPKPSYICEYEMTLNILHVQVIVFSVMMPHGDEVGSQCFIGGRKNLQNISILHHYVAS